jgi:catechol 2,3-dioxygenase-like lactoylglutathione lyase family enzyme
VAYSLALSHVGIFVADVERMVDFYTRFLGFAVSDRGGRGAREIVFLTRDPREHHQLVLVAGRPREVPFNVVNQLSFRVDGLETLRELYRGLADWPVEGREAVTHGNALSVYFLDPERNRVELLIDTPWYIPQPYRLAVDLFLPDAELWAFVERHCRAVPGFRPREQWAAEIEERIAQATAARLRAPEGVVSR